MNYDYLMGVDLDMSCPKPVEALETWGRWYIDTVEWTASGWTQLSISAMTFMRAG